MIPPSTRIVGISMSPFFLNHVFLNASRMRMGNMSTKQFQPKQRHYSLFSLFARAVLKESLVLQILSTSLFSSPLFCFPFLLRLCSGEELDLTIGSHVIANLDPPPRVLVARALFLSTLFLPTLPTSDGTGSSNDPCCAELFRSTGQLVMDRFHRRRRAVKSAIVLW